MAQINKINHILRKSKTLFIVLAFGLALLINVSTADAKSWEGKKSPSSNTLRSMARIYMAYGEYAKAQPLVEKALTLARRKGTPDSELAMCFIDMAILYHNQGKLIEAEELCKSGFYLQEKTLFKNHPYLAHTLRTLSSIYQDQGDYHQAKAALDKAMAIMLDSHSEDDKAMTPFFVDIAELLVAQGDFEQAEHYYHRAMVLINNSYGPEHLYTANVLSSIAKLYTFQGKYTDAEEMINRAVAIQEKVYGPNHHLIVSSWLIKAEVCQVTGNYVQAESLINKALGAVEKTRNAVALAKLEQRVEKIRASRQVAYGPVAKTNK